MNNLKNNNIKDLLKQYNDLVKEKQEIQAAIDKIQRELDKMEAEGYTEKDSVTGGNGGKQHFVVEGFPYPAYSQKRTLLLVRQKIIPDCTVSLSIIRHNVSKRSFCLTS